MATKRSHSKQAFERTIKEILRTATTVGVTESSGGYIRLPTDDSPDAKKEEDVDVFERLFLSNYFQGFMTTLILANAVLIGLETDMPHALPWSWAENILLGIFCFELWLNVRVQGGLEAFFTIEGNPEINWNVFDFSVVTLGVVDLIASHLFNAKSGGATVFRICRLLRILRLVRIFKFLKKLFLLAVGFVEAVQALFWTSILIFVALYMCSILMVRTVGRLPAEDPHAEFLHEKFSDVRTSMLTLFVLMSSTDLPTFIREDGLVWDRPLLLVFLVAFVLVGSFGMLALLTGVVNESMFEKNQVRMEEARKEAEQTHVVLDCIAGQVFEQLLLDEEGCAQTVDVVEVAMPMIAAVFNTMGVDFNRHSLAELVNFMDTDGSGTIDREEFQKAIVSFARGVSHVSIQEVLHTVLATQRKVDRLEQALVPIGSRRRGSVVLGQGAPDRRSSLLAPQLQPLQQTMQQSSPDAKAGGLGLVQELEMTLKRDFQRPSATLEPKLATSELAKLREDHERNFRALLELQAAIQQDLQQVLRPGSSRSFERCDGAVIAAAASCWPRPNLSALPSPPAAPPGLRVRAGSSASGSAARSCRLPPGPSPDEVAGPQQEHMDRYSSSATGGLPDAGHAGGSAEEASTSIPSHTTTGSSSPPPARLNGAALWPESPQTKL